MCASGVYPTEPCTSCPCTPGLTTFFWYMWSEVISQVYNAPAEEQAHEERITRLIELVREIKGTSHPNGEEWLLWGQKTSWQDLPRMGATLRDHYHAPVDLRYYQKTYDAQSSQEALRAIRGAASFEPDSLGGQVAKSRHNWLSYHHFTSRLWRDCDCQEYALYAIWAIRSALEDWPESPPSFEVEYLFDQDHTKYEESPEHRAVEVETAAIWICNTAPLMYACTEIWGPKGAPDWPKDAGVPGRGGRRWDGVDGYDREHGRWRLWKDVLGEVVRWCDVEEERMRGWKVRDAAVRALRAMEEVEKDAA